MTTEPLSKNQQALLDWLCNHWLDSGPGVAFVEGFDGTGKSTVARETVRRAEAGGWRAALLRPSESRATAADDLILEIAQELAFKGEKGLVQALDQGQDLWEALARVLSGTRTLLVIDEAQVAMLDEGGRLPTEVHSFVRQIASRVQQGRLLLVSDRAFPDGLASGRHTIRRLDGLTDEEAVAYLTGRLTADGIPDAVPPERRLEVLRALGNNLDAIQILGVALRDEDSLDELIGLEPDLWSIDDRQFDPKLLKDLERKLLARILSRLEPDTRRVLGRYSVHRKPIKAKAFKTAQVGIPDLIQRREVLVRSFLVQHHIGWDAPRPLVREIVLAQLQAQPQERRGYHSLAADHYARHFEARKVEDVGGLGGYFVEARYHLTRAGRDDELGRIAAHFQDHLSRTIESVTPVPVDREELDERIALLLGLYRDKQGPAGLEYHLARCLAQRDGPDDWREALVHARRACGPRAPGC
ncbi:MAG TPA: ATP-binding protein [Lamprocystis sp. (in: g-proteobacteria)]|nr:ATP-binding protein [Lamprocystis sp. (in: g-proteobacteria)]